MTETRLMDIDISRTKLQNVKMYLTEFMGSEGISMPFGFELTLLSETHNIDFEKIIGENVTVSITLPDGNKRYFNGIISRFSQLKRGGEKGQDPRFSHYRAFLVPWLWLLTRYTNSKIFQNMAIPDIVMTVCQQVPVNSWCINRTEKEHKKRGFCVQYHETDFNFISRLLEEEGIYYFFEHTDKNHALVLADVPEKHIPCPKQEEAWYQNIGGGDIHQDIILNLEKIQEIRSAAYTLRDYNYKTPDTDLQVNASTPSKYKLGPGGREIYDYPGFYYTRSDGDRIVNLRMEEEEAKITTILGSSDCRAFTSGYRFKLLGHYRSDMNEKEFVLTYIDHEAHEVSQAYSSPGSAASEGESELSYKNHFTCIPFEVPFRPPRRALKPVIRGPQTAIVVGPEGEESYTDEVPYGMIRVQFHWDREGQKNEKSSCWLRVATPYAGEKHGMEFTPLIGDEVLVEFLEGDPDKPVVVGSFFKGDHKALIQSKEMVKNEILTAYQHRLLLDDKEKNITLNTGQDISLHLGDDDKEDHKNIKLTIDKDYHYLLLSEEPGFKRIFLDCDHHICIRSAGGQSDIDLSTEKNQLSVNLDDIQNNITLSGKTFSITLDGNSGAIKINSTAGTIDLTTIGTVNINGTASVKINGAAGVQIIGGAMVDITGAIIKLNAAMVQATGIIQCVTLMAPGGVISPQYTTGLGNIL
jgi:type VI secretion system VgrG family protein